MNGMMDGSRSMIWGTGLWGVLILVVVVLGVAALTKYLLFDNRG